MDRKADLAHSKEEGNKRKSSKVKSFEKQTKSDRQSLNLAIIYGWFKVPNFHDPKDILAIEKNFGTELREYAVRISKERYAIRKEALSRGFQSTYDMQQK